MELERSCQPTDHEGQLPGFRFHPTEEELLVFYLKGVAHGTRPGLLDIIGNVNIYRHEPWELPGLAKIGEREWYFFVPRDRKNGANGAGRPNRTTETGFWKATGSDRHIRHAKEPKRVLGLKKTLVFYMGRAPRGTKTDWVMNEYRLPDTCTLPKEEIVLCKIYRKATSLKVLEQRAAREEGPVTMVLHDAAAFSGDANSCSNQEVQLQKIAPLNFEQVFKEEEVTEREEEMISPCQVDQRSKEPLSELHVPAYGSFDWGQDPFLLRSPWMENWASFVNVMFNY